MPRTKGSKNKKPAQGRITPYATISVAGSPDEIARVRSLAAKEGKTVSRYLLDLVPKP